MNEAKKQNTIDLDTARTTIRRFIKGKLLQAGSNGYVLGLSGGVDSSLAAALAVEAVGPDKVLGIMMPYKTSSESSITDAELLAKHLGIKLQKVDISAMVDAYFSKIDDSLKIRAGNKMARERMAILFDIAQETGRLVLGTGNRSESCLGYTTWYGDSACSINPVGELYKTEIRAMAELLGLPQQIITKVPSADLWVGQTDEDEIGVTYDTIDKILKRIVDEDFLSISSLVKEGFDSRDISRVVSLLNLNSFKRHLPDVAPLGRRQVPDYIELSE
ncbi:MAG: NAD+ synthase [candidate division Zixibacteria bacterium]|nr:NAD+ synthase [candidate division Zixibacteria bacterium]